MISDTDKTIKVEVTVEKGRVSFPQEIDEKSLKQTFHSEMVLSETDFVNSGLFQSLFTEVSVEFLPAKSYLLVNVSLKDVPVNLQKHLVEPEPKRPFGVSGGFVETVLLEEQKIKLRGGKKAQLLNCGCDIPALKGKAKSLNHAYSLISTAFEPWRRSHTGNVFQKVFWHGEEQGEWRALDTLREQIQAQRRAKGSADASEVSTASDGNNVTPPESRVTATNLPIRDRSREYAWLERHRDEYEGKYVALVGEKLIAQGNSFKEVAVEARGRSINALIVFVEGSQTPPHVGGFW